MKKNIIWLAVSATSFMLLIIAMFAVGFNYSFGSGQFSSTITGTLKNMETDSNPYGWLVSGLVFSGVALLATAMKLILDANNAKQKLNQKSWDFIFAGIISFAILLMIIGSGVAFNETTSGIIKVNVGMAFLLFLMIFLAWGVTIVPFFIGKPKKNSKRKTAVQAK